MPASQDDIDKGINTTEHELNTSIGEQEACSSKSVNDTSPTITGQRVRTSTSASGNLLSTPTLQRTKSAPGTPGRSDALSPSTTSSTARGTPSVTASTSPTGEFSTRPTTRSSSSYRNADTDADAQSTPASASSSRPSSTFATSLLFTGGRKSDLNNHSGDPDQSSKSSSKTTLSKKGDFPPHTGEGTSRRSITPSPSPSRKGKERATDIGLEQRDAEIDQSSAPLVALGMMDAADIEVSGQMISAGHQQGDAAKGLRALVRRSTDASIRSRPGPGSRAGSTRTTGKAGRSRPVSLVDDVAEMDPDPPPDQGRVYTPRRYYVLTHAGKPVFTSHSSENEDVTELVAVAQAIISIFAEDDDRLRSIVKGRYRIAFLLKAPLYLFCISDWGEPEHVHLEYIHLQILSVVTSTQLSRALQRRSNFDVSRLLEGTETFLHKLIERAQSDFTYLTSTLQPLRLAPAIRDTAAAALMPSAKFNDLLYVLLIAGGHIVTLLRPRKHSIHPSDLHLLLNTIASSETLRTSETWLPICLPKFNAAGFVHAYISFILDDIGLVFVSADKEAFEDLRGWKDIVVGKLEKDKTLTKIQNAMPEHEYSVSALGCPGLRHFIYKSRQLVQLTCPIWEKPYLEDSARNRLLTIYHKLHDAVHARSGQASSLKLVYLKTDQEACLAWITLPFELYLTVSPQLSKSAVVAIANTVARWVSAEEGKIFLKDAPVF